MSDDERPPIPAWLFHGGEWTEIEDPRPKELLDEQDDVALPQMGYHAHAQYRVGLSDCGGEVAVHRKIAHREAPYAYLVNATLGSHMETIFVRDFPNLVQLLNQLVPLVDSSLRWEERKERLYAEEEARRRADQDRRRRGSAL